MFTCTRGHYITAGIVSHVCGEDGQWAGDMPTCSIYGKINNSPSDE